MESQTITVFKSPEQHPLLVLQSNNVIQKVNSLSYTYSMQVTYLLVPSFGACDLDLVGVAFRTTLGGFSTSVHKALTPVNA